MSARGLALNVGQQHARGVPDFVAHWIAPAASESDPVIVHSLLDGPSVCGAYRFLIYATTRRGHGHREPSVPAPDVERLGIAPLTSMFWYAEYGRRRSRDWRPEVHDSDGLAIWNGDGERIWRPLNNPTRIFHTSYLDQTPKGFGLIQRDRIFDHYLDGVGYDRRPSDLGRATRRLGRGTVQLVEIPTDDEIHDNIAAYWVPTAGQGRRQPRPTTTGCTGSPTSPASQDALAKSSRRGIGRGGQPGRPRPHGRLQIQVEFSGSTLANLPFGVMPEPLDLGEPWQGLAGPDGSRARRRARRWRLFFDLKVDGGRPVDIRRIPQAGRIPCSARPGSTCSSRLSMRNLWST